MTLSLMLLIPLIVSVIVGLKPYKEKHQDSYKCSDRVLVFLVTLLDFFLKLVIFLLAWFIMYKWARMNGFTTIYYCDSFTQNMDNNVIPRTPLLKPGETIATKAVGIHSITGGYAELGITGYRNMVRIIAIHVESSPFNPAFKMIDPVYDPSNQPFNQNLAKILYEIRAAGKPKTDFLCLTHAFDSHNTHKYFYHKYLDSYKLQNGLSTVTGETGISSRLLNALAGDQ